MANVKIITDSAADLTEDVVKQLGIDVVPLSIRFDDEEFTDGIELTRETFWNRIAESSDLPSTSAPSPGAFETAFKQAASDGFDSVVCLLISSKISATYQIGLNAAKAVSDSITVHVVDTQACTIAEGLLVIEAANLAQKGQSAQSIISAIDDLKTRVHLYGALDTLENLRKGGRIGAANAFFGSLLSIKPIVGLVDGEVKAIGRARTRGKALDALLDILKEHSNAQHITIGHAYAPDIATIRDRFRDATSAEELPVAIIGPVVGAHTGPRLTAISFVTPTESGKPS